MNRFLALMIYVAVFLGGFTLTASIGIRGVTGADTKDVSVARVSGLDFGSEQKIDLTDSHTTSYKIFVKKKMKKRYRARWCEYSPIPYVAAKQHIIYDDVVVYCILRSVINERCIRTFGLRGPPTAHIA